MRKFIISSEGDFRFGDVHMHKDLLQEYRALVIQGRVWNYKLYYDPNKVIVSDYSMAQIVIEGNTISSDINSPSVYYDLNGIHVSGDSQRSLYL